MMKMIASFHKKIHDDNDLVIEADAAVDVDDDDVVVVVVDDDDVVVVAAAVVLLGLGGWCF